MIQYPSTSLSDSSCFVCITFHAYHIVIMTINACTAIIGTIDHTIKISGMSTRLPIHCVSLILNSTSLRCSDLKVPLRYSKKLLANPLHNNTSQIDLIIILSVTKNNINKKAIETTADNIPLVFKPCER
ncbi:MAG: hypothetical protein WCG25_07745 [bacterium]